MNVDGNKPESVVNLTGNRNAVLVAAWACFAVGVSWLWRLTTGWVRMCRTALLLSTLLRVTHHSGFDNVAC